jgi:hypothetical protein
VCGDEQRVIGRDAVEVVVVERAHGQDLDLGPGRRRLGAVRWDTARIGSGQERFDCIGWGGLVDHGDDIDGYAVSVAEADGDGNTVNDGVAADTGFAECTNRADQANHFRAGKSEGVSARPQGASGVVRDR